MTTTNNSGEEHRTNIPISNDMKNKTCKKYVSQIKHENKKELGINFFSTKRVIKTFLEQQKQI